MIAESWTRAAALIAAIGGAVAASAAFVPGRGCVLGNGNCASVAELPAATLFELPVAAFGVIAYAAAAVLAIVPVTQRRLRLRATLAAAMGTMSLWLLANMAAARVLCGLCLGSALSTFFLWWLANLAGSRERRAGRALAGCLATVALLVADASWRRLSLPATAADLTAEDATRRRELAEHLRDRGDVLYGAFWCPECAEQKRLFGAAADALPYVECGFGSPRADVQTLPTWVIDGLPLQGPLTIAELERRTGFRPAH